MDIFERYKDEPYFQLKVGLTNEYTLFVKWNVFKDKKDNYMPVLRPRYVLVDKDNNRLSLKILNLKEPVAFEQIYISEDIQDIIEVAKTHNYREMLIHTHFGRWINKDFQKMINSGDCKIISMETHK